MQRRQFLCSLGWGLAAGWTISRWGWPAPAQASTWPPRLAFLADSHLPDGKAQRPEARALARAVAEIRALRPAPDLVLFAGDLAHAGSTNALALGKEILSDLPAPLAAVRGEGDSSGNGYAAWSRLFGAPRFSYVFPESFGNTCPLEPREKTGNLNSSLLRKTENGKQKTAFQILGLHTALTPSPQGPVFQVGGEQRRWLSQEIARLDPDLPLVILSHAPLVEIFRPWRQWSKDGPEVIRLLTRFSRVYCFHGHVHNGAVSDQLSAIGYDREGINRMEALPHLVGGTGCQGISRYGLPSTAWPLPTPLQGTLAAPRPGLGPRGCGWALVSLGNDSLQYQPQVWQV